jgi:hypothetical protein
MFIIPEMVSIAGQRMKSLIESDFNLETVTVAGDQLQGCEGKIRGRLEAA